MEKTDYTFDDFLVKVDEEFRTAVTKIHESLIEDNFKAKIESKSSGFFVSYSHHKTKRSMINFLFRKKALLIRIYSDNIAKHSDLLNRLTEDMEAEIGKASVCKRLINPEDCNPKCVMGYDFFIRENRYQKCRYNCFQFEINKESLPFISEFVENEQRERRAV